MFIWFPISSENKNLIWKLDECFFLPRIVPFRLNYPIIERFSKKKHLSFRSLYRFLNAFDKRQAVNISSFLKFVLIGSLCIFGTTLLVSAQEEPRVEISADEIVIDGDNRVKASGNVEITYGNYVISTDNVEFGDNYYTFNDPIYIVDDSGTGIVADFISLSPEEQQGVIEGLRILYQNRLQITTETVRRANGSLVLFNNVITTCSICKAGETPLWYFQADSITLREDGGRVHLKNVRFKVWDVTILYLPWFSIVSPTSGRQSGFLVPEVRYNSSRGFEAKIPYYHVLDDHSDLTLSFGRTAANETGGNLEFRNNSKSGWIFFEAAYPFRERNLGLFQQDLVLTGIQKPDETSQFSFLITDTSADNTAYPSGLFPENNKLILLEAKKTLPIGELTFRTIDVSPFTPGPPPGTNNQEDTEENDDDDTEENNKETTNTFERFISLGLKTRDLLPSSRASLSLELKFNSTLQNQANIVEDSETDDQNQDSTDVESNRYHDFKHVSLLGKFSDTKIFNSGIKSSTTFFLLGEAYRNDAPEARKRANYGRALMVNNLSFPLVMTGGKNYQTFTPFIQVVYSQDNNKDLPNRPEALQVIDRSKFLSNHQDIVESWIRDGREISLGVKYFTSFQDNKFDFVIGKTILKPDRDPKNKPEYVHGGDQETHYFAEGILDLGGNIELTSLFVGDNNFRAVSNYSRFALMNSDYEAGVSYGWIRGEDYKDKSKSASSYLKIPISDQWTGFANFEYDFLGESKRKYELGAVYHHQCVTFEISAERTLKTDMTDKSSPDYSIGVSLVGFTSASTLSTKNCN